MELPADVQIALDELGDGAEIRLLAIEDDGFNRVPVWGCGWRQPLHRDVTAAAGKMKNDPKLDAATRHLAAIIFEGWKPAFVVKGRITVKAVGEMQKRDWKWRERRREITRAMDAMTDRAIQQKKQGQSIEDSCRELMVGEQGLMYNLWVKDRHSVSMPGRDSTGYLAGIESPNFR